MVQSSAALVNIHIRLPGKFLVFLPLFFTMCKSTATNRYTSVGHLQSNLLAISLTKSSRPERALASGQNNDVGKGINFPDNLIVCFLLGNACPVEFHTEWHSTQRCLS